MRLRTLIPLVGLFAFVLHGATAIAAAQSADFAVSQNGKPVGTASFTFASKPTGVDSASLVRVDMQGLNYSLSKTEELSPANSLLHVQLSAIVNNSAVSVVAKPDGAQFLMNISANGRANTTRLDVHKSTVFLPDFDAGALQTLLTIAATNNNRDLWAILPKQAGSISPIQLATYPDEQGTLDAKPITVHHLIATIAGNTTDLFAGPENQLLQAELPQQGFALVRKGFVLTPPAKPLAPPPAPPGAAPTQ
ncbi:MAG TPA: hypothetical protein VK574_12195 [Terracidiphilus sp.]|nr:hypothetical protein [Terracidiphilus sp.]